MSWKNQSGGPWGSGPRSPWGSGPSSSGPTPPDIEDLIRRSQDQLRNLMPGSFGAKGIAVIIALVVFGWLMSGWYRVQPNEQGVVLQFGRFVGTTTPGLNYHWPYPIQSVLLPRVTEINTINIGMRVGEDTRRGTSVMRDVPEESLMLTGDENIVDVDFAVFWRISNAENYLFNVQNPEGTIKAVAESAMREVIGRTNIQPILTGARQGIETGVQDLMQSVLNGYKAGVEITQVQMQKVDPPSQVIDAFRDVQAARADAERSQNEAQTYANRVLPEARGEASRIDNAAQAYRERTVVEARGQAARFLKIYDEYQKAKVVTRERMYLETMERVLGGLDKVLVDQSATRAGAGAGASAGQGVVPVLPLSDMLRRTPAPAAQTQQGAPR
ncbi:FtsH protease activity modulator HflK [Xanthobacter dioxanivorans]|uniref:Protein HflK n=1 Tax=Xanthobacter dioxanivorans TaxID=2528964 RepID=A0A974SH31_9HYPH|nr:FtsH protease activity modulator HflK [Xanthobacter dioxanivorans]QRG04972.1 FtsH protease activity modulator HflK [Xanthobacter dioxanivorans]